MIKRLASRELKTKFGTFTEILYYDGQKESIAIVMGDDCAEDGEPRDCGHRSAGIAAPAPRVAAHLELRAATAVDPYAAVVGAPAAAAYAGRLRGLVLQSRVSVGVGAAILVALPVAVASDRVRRVRGRDG